jgi:large subunit ribosomal protein L32
MAVPKKRTSRRRKGMRRAHDALNYKAAVSICDNCGGVKLSHHICESCGFYRGRQILSVSIDDEGSEDLSEEQSEDLSVE